MSNYWSSTTRADDASVAWVENFSLHFPDAFPKTDNTFNGVRAVRGGCACTGGKVLDPSGLCVCPTGQTEDVGGTCQCPNGQVKCNGTCTDTQIDPNNCGTCGNVCGAGQVCDSGACCTPATCGAQDCGMPSDGCGGMLDCGPCPTSTTTSSSTTTTTTTIASSGTCASGGIACGNTCGGNPNCMCIGTEVSGCSEEHAGSFTAVCVTGPAGSSFCASDANCPAGSACVSANPCAPTATCIGMGHCQPICPEAQ